MYYSEERWFAHQYEQCPECKWPVTPANAYCDRCGQDLVGGETRQGRRRKTTKCIYCEKVARRSDEDIFPRWLSRTYPGRGAFLPNIVRRTSEYCWPRQAPIFVASTRGPSRDAYRLITNSVCKPCNNGWMSRIQGRVKPIIVRLVQSKKLSLSVEERLTLSQWAVMTFTNIGFAENFASTEQYQRSDLKAGRMPAGWLVGVGHLADTKLAGAYERYASAMPIGLNDKPFTPVTSGWLAIENLVFGHIHAFGDQTVGLTGLFGLGPEERIASAGLSLLWPSPEQPWEGKSGHATFDSLQRLCLNDII